MTKKAYRLSGWPYKETYDDYAMEGQDDSKIHTFTLQGKGWPSATLCKSITAAGYRLGHYCDVHSNVLNGLLC